MSGLGARSDGGKAARVKRKGWLLPQEEMGFQALFGGVAEVAIGIGLGFLPVYKDAPGQGGESRRQGFGQRGRKGVEVAAAELL